MSSSHKTYRDVGKDDMLAHCRALYRKRLRSQNDWNAFRATFDVEGELPTEMPYVDDHDQRFSVDVTPSGAREIRREHAIDSMRY